MQVEVEVGFVTEELLAQGVLVGGVLEAIVALLLLHQERLTQAVAVAVLDLPEVEAVYQALEAAVSSSSPTLAHSNSAVV
jgi:hypothetical protein